MVWLLIIDYKINFRIADELIIKSIPKLRELLDSQEFTLSVCFEEKKINSNLNLEHYFGIFNVNEIPLKIGFNIYPLFKGFTALFFFALLPHKILTCSCFFPSFMHTSENMQHYILSTKKHAQGAIHHFHTTNIPNKENTFVSLEGPFSISLITYIF